MAGRPEPMGSLEYISPDANVVAGFVVKDPAALVDDLLGVWKRFHLTFVRTWTSFRQSADWISVETLRPLSEVSLRSQSTGPFYDPVVEDGI